MDVIQFNKFAKLHNDKNIFFCKTDYVLDFFKNIQNHKEPSVLITGNSDHAISDSLVKMAPACIKKWFGQSMLAVDPRVDGLPYGVENTDDCIIEGHGLGHKRYEKLFMAQNPPIREPRKNIYANFSMDTHPIRKQVTNICEKQQFITDRITRDHTTINNLPYQMFVSEILDHKMSVCPRGNAPADSHRFWEVLYMDRVPIVKTSKGNSYFLDLPVVCLDDWEELNDLNHINKKYEQVKNNSREKLDMSYWEKKILNALD